MTTDPTGPTDPTAANRAELEALDAFVCPECMAGKHGNCDGTAWDDIADEERSCQCGEDQS